MEQKNVMLPLHQTAMFKRNKQGFLPELMEKMYTERVVFKKKSIELKKEYQKTKRPNISK